MLLILLLTVSTLAAVAATLQTCAVQGLGAVWVLPVSFLGVFLAQAAILFLVIWISCMLVKNKPAPEKESKYFRFLIQQVCYAAIPILMIRVHKKGLEQTPKSGRFLLVCNHLHNVDPAFILRSFPKKGVAFIAKREADKMFLVGSVLKQLRCQLINRENDREALKTILQCIKMLKEDEASIAVFPEGRITGDELMHPFRSGVFKIALKTQVPIVVCTLYGTQNVLKNAMRLKPSDVDFHLVKVIYPEEYAGMTATEVGNMAYELMAQDLGPDKVWQKPENMEEEE